MFPMKQGSLSSLNPALRSVLHPKAPSSSLKLFSRMYSPRARIRGSSPETPAWARNSACHVVALCLGA